MGDTDSFYSESNESLIDEIFGTLSRNRSLRRDEVKGKKFVPFQWSFSGLFQGPKGLNENYLPVGIKKKVVKSEVWIY